MGQIKDLFGLERLPIKGLIECSGVVQFGGDDVLLAGAVQRGIGSSCSRIEGNNVLAGVTMHTPQVLKTWHDRPKRTQTFGRGNHEFFEISLEPQRCAGTGIFVAFLAIDCSNSQVRSRINQPPPGSLISPERIALTR
jgi:hypothetical protein